MQWRYKLNEWWDANAGKLWSGKGTKSPLTISVLRRREWKFVWEKVHSKRKWSQRMSVREHSERTVRKIKDNGKRGKERALVWERTDKFLGEKEWPLIDAEERPLTYKKETSSAKAEWIVHSSRSRLFRFRCSPSLILSQFGRTKMLNLSAEWIHLGSQLFCCFSLCYSKRLTDLFHSSISAFRLFPCLP